MVASDFTIEPYGISFYLFIVLLTIPIIKYLAEKYIDKYFDDSLSKKKANVWKNRMLGNPSVKKSLESYNNLGLDNFSRTYPFIFIGAILGYFVPILIVDKVIINMTDKFIAYFELGVPLDKLLSITIPTAFFIIVFIYIICADKLIKQFREINDRDLIDKYSSTLNKSIALISFTVAFFIICLLYFSVLFRLKGIVEDYFIGSIAIFVVVGILLFVVLISTLFNLQSYKNRIKGYLNLGNESGYPYVRAFTVNNSEINGKLKDPFDSTFLVVKNVTGKEMILWSSIDSLTIENNGE